MYPWGDLMSARLAGAVVLMLTVFAGLPAPPASAAGPTCAGRPATVVGTSGPDELTGTRGPDVIVGLGGDDTVLAKGGRDVVCGGGGSDIVLGQAGDDQLRGGAGMDALMGMAGDDTLRGEGDIDVAAYLSATRGVVADAAAGTVRGEGRDRLVDTEGFIGSGHNDLLRGGPGVNAFFGGGGDDTIEGGGGADWVFYGLADQGVSVDLALGSATGGEGEDGLASIENVVGSDYDDTLLGDALGNYLDGVGGYDLVDGRGADNLCYGESVTSCYQDVFPTSDVEPSGPSAASGISASASARTLLAKALSDARIGRAVPGQGASRPPEGGVLADDEPSSRPNYTYVNCPMLTGALWFNLPRWSGLGYYAYRAYRPLTGYDDWTYGPWLYYDDSGWQVYFNGEWYTVPQSYAVIPGGTSLPIEVAYYYAPQSSWSSMGGCNTTAPAFGVYLG